MKQVLFIAAGVIGLCGCGTAMKALKKQASFDMECSENELQFTELGSRKMGAQGCEQKATYLWKCSKDGVSCEWIKLSDSGASVVVEP